MKKGLSLLLAASVAFSAFSATAFAAQPQTAQEKYDALVEAGIFEGFEDGQARLDEPMTRAQAAKIVTLVLGLQENAAAASVYKDLAGAEWAAGYIGAATKAGILNGRGNGVFDPSSDVTIQELAKIMVEALEIDVDASATVEGADEWAAPYVAAAVAAGLIAEQDDYKAAASRTILVEASYSAYEQVKNEEVAGSYSVEAIGAKKFSVNFGAAIDPSKVELTVKKGSVTVNTETPVFSEDKKSAIIETTTKLTKGEYTITAKNAAAEELTTTVSVEDEKVQSIQLNGDVAAATFTGNSITGATMTYRVLNQYGEDITANRGINWTSTLGTVTSDNKGKLTFTYNFQKDQTFFVTGYVTGTTTTVSQQVKVGDRAYVNAIEVKELFHKDGKELNTGSNFTEYALLLEAKDQYGNKVDAAAFNNDVYFYTNNPSVAGIAAAVSSDNGKDGDQLGLKLDNPATKFEGSAVINFVPKFGGPTATFTVNVAKAAEVTTFTLSMPEGVVGAGDTVTIPFSAADQFGKEVTKYSALNGKITLSPESPDNGTTTGLYFEENPVTGVATLKFKAPTTTGIQVLHAIPKVTGTTAPTSSMITLEVKDAKVGTTIANYKGDKLNLQEGAVTTIKGSDVVVHDQYGMVFSVDKVFNAAAGAGYGIKVTSSNPAILKVNGANILTDNKDNTVQIEGVAKGTAKVKFELFKDADNDGALDLGEDVNGNGVLDSGEDANSNNRIDGSELVYGATYEKTFNVLSKADIAEYVADDAKVIYAGADRTADHDVALDIYGKTSSGAKVVLKTANITSVTTSVYGVSYNAGKLVVNNPADVYTDAGKIEDDKKGIAVVIIDADGKTVSLEKEVVVTEAARKITTIAHETNGSGIDMKDGAALAQAAEANNNLVNLKKIFVAKDQYGVKFADIGNRAFISFTEIKDADKDGSITATPGFAGGATGLANITGLEVGDSFVMNVVTENGVKSSIKVIIVN